MNFQVIIHFISHFMKAILTILYHLSKNPLKNFLIVIFQLFISYFMLIKLSLQYHQEMTYIINIIIDIINNITINNNINIINIYIINIH